MDLTLRCRSFTPVHECTLKSTAVCVFLIGMTCVTSCFINLHVTSELIVSCSMKAGGLLTVSRWRLHSTHILLKLHSPCLRCWGIKMKTLSVFIYYSFLSHLCASFCLMPRPSLSFHLLVFTIDKKGWLLCIRSIHSFRMFPMKLVTHQNGTWNYERRNSGMTHATVVPTVRHMNGTRSSFLKVHQASGRMVIHTKASFSWTWQKKQLHLTWSHNISTCVYKYICICMCVWKIKYVLSCWRVHNWLWSYKCQSVGVCVCVCVSVCLCVCVCVCVCVCFTYLVNRADLALRCTERPQRVFTGSLNAVHINFTPNGLFPSALQHLQQTMDHSCHRMSWQSIYIYIYIYIYSMSSNSHGILYH